MNGRVIGLHHLHCVVQSTTQCSYLRIDPFCSLHETNAERLSLAVLESTTYGAFNPQRQFSCPFGER